jgi:hypothetical protein
VQAGEASVAAAAAPDARMLLVLEALHREAAVQLHLTQARARAWDATRRTRLNATQICGDSLPCPG